MLSIKSSLCSVLLLATYATAATQSAINLKVEYCSKDNTGASNDQGQFLSNCFRLACLSLANLNSQVPTSTSLWALATTSARANSPTRSCSTRNVGAPTKNRLTRSAWRTATSSALATLTSTAATRVLDSMVTCPLTALLSPLVARQPLR